MEPSDRDPMLDRVPGKAQLGQLGPSNHPMLAAREPPDAVRHRVGFRAAHSPHESPLTRIRPRAREYAGDLVYAGPISRLITELSRLPGIGQRTAQRLAFHVLRTSDEEALALADAIREVKEKVGLCEVCFNLAEGERCRICEDSRRDASLICVVEEPADVIPIERTGEYRGVYHVLGGALSPIDGIDPEDLKIAELVERVGGETTEVVLATNPTTTGEATAQHIAALLRDRVTITRLASGLPVGADLEHADEVTLGKALAGRRSA